MPLTHRQSEILSLLARAFTNAEISMECNISEKTVKVHVSAILKALDVPNRTAAALVHLSLPWGPEGIGEDTGYTEEEVDADIEATYADRSNYAEEEV